MYVCICHGVTERDIERLKRTGCRSLKSVQRNCHAGSDCGSCLLKIRDMLEGVEKQEKNG